MPLKQPEAKRGQGAKRETMRETPREFCRVHSTSGGKGYGGI